MHIQRTKFDGVLILTPEMFEDHRGSFYESYSKREFLKNGISYNFVQDNHSYNKHQYTFRGLHYQINPHPQTTLVRVVSGEIIDFVVDIRKGSPTFGQYISEILSEQNHKQMIIPEGFAHGFLTLTDNVNMLYKMDSFYSPDHDRILNFNDPKIGIKLGIDIDKLIIAYKDKTSPFIEYIDNNFIYASCD
jgi:dTDP-4-dehydrorhamnose 3,5-epimerase